MFGEFREVREMNEVGGKFGEIDNSRKQPLSKKVLETLDKKVECIRKFNSINKEVIYQTTEIKDLWNLRYIITDELDYRLSLFNRDNFGQRTVELEKIETLNIKHKISIEDYQFNLLVMYNLVKELNSKQDVKNLKSKTQEIPVEASEETEKESIKDQDIFKYNVSESKEFVAINAIRKAAGKEPMKSNEKLDKFLGKDSKKSMKESLDNIAENIKKDPEFKKKILDILHE